MKIFKCEKCGVERKMHGFEDVTGIPCDEACEGISRPIEEKTAPVAKSPAAMAGSMDWLANEITALIPLISEDTFYDVLKAMETQGLDERAVIKLEDTWNKFGQKNP